MAPGWLYRTRIASDEIDPLACLTPEEYLDWFFPDGKGTYCS